MCSGVSCLPYQSRVTSKWCPTFFDHIAQTPAAGGQSPTAHILLLKSTAGIEMQYVPYKSGSQAHPDVISGRVPILWDSVGASLVSAQYKNPEMALHVKVSGIEMSCPGGPHSLSQTNSDAGRRGSRLSP